MSVSFFSKESIIGWFLLLLSVVYGYFSFSFPAGVNEPGPSFIPIFLAAGLLVTSVILIFQGRKIKEKKEENLLISRQHLLLLTSLIVYWFILPLIGFIISSILFLFFVFLLYGNKGYIRTLIYSIVLTLIMYYIFKVLLNVPLNLM